MTSAVGGSGIAADVAAQQHIQWVNNLGGDYKIGSPAVARGSTQWMDVSHLLSRARYRAPRRLG